MIEVYIEEWSFVLLFTFWMAAILFSTTIGLLIYAINRHIQIDKETKLYSEMYSLWEEEVLNFVFEATTLDETYRVIQHSAKSMKLEFIKSLFRFFETLSGDQPARLAKLCKKLELDKFSIERLKHGSVAEILKVLGFIRYLKIPVDKEIIFKLLKKKMTSSHLQLSKPYLT